MLARFCMPAHEISPARFVFFFFFLGIWDDSEGLGAGGKLLECRPPLPPTGTLARARGAGAEKGAATTPYAHATLHFAELWDGHPQTRRRKLRVRSGMFTRNARHGATFAPGRAAQTREGEEKQLGTFSPGLGSKSLCPILCPPSFNTGIRW
jgi:hypothetical protein